jgi:hypothetical protein
LNIFKVTSGAFGETQNMRNSVAANVNLHGASPWHPKKSAGSFRSNERETPPDKPVASFRTTQSQNRKR